MSALLLNIQEGDEVIIPSFTFVSTVNAFVLRGAVPVFADIRSDTKNLDEMLLEQLITPKTKAIVPVHYAGVGAEMETIMAVADSYSIPVVEDNAHGIFGKYKGRLLGSFGKISTLSFHETKNLQCGEGGALVLNDLEFVQRAEIIREKGTNRARFFRGQVDKYSWVDIGSSYLPSEMLAAFLCAQLEEKEFIQQRRKDIWSLYNSELSDWAQQFGVGLPLIPTHCEQSFHMFYMMLPNASVRQSLIDYLRKSGIWSVFHYLPLHTSDMGMKYGYKKGDCPISEDVSERLLRLPFYIDLRKEEQLEIISKIKEFCPSKAALGRA
jgi:dTDP-4-amino-4,6-dideoxygalactose transaminase